MAIDLKRDDSGAIIQVLAPDDASTVVGTSSVSAVSLALPLNSEVVEVSASAGLHWVFGTSGTNATVSKKYQGGGSIPYKVPSGATHISFIAATGVASALCSVTRLY